VTSIVPRRPICMIVHAYYEEDTRVRREAETLVAAGWQVDVFALRRPGEGRIGLVAGVKLHRLPVGRHQGAGLPVYLAEYGSFLAQALWAATREHRRRRYAMVEVHSLPDYLVFAALPIKLSGVPVLLDLHEAMPEFFRTRFPRAANPISYRLLRLQEKLSIAFANEVMTVNETLAERLRGLGVKPDRVTVALNSPDLALFNPIAHPRREFMADGTLRLVYTGAITPTYELDVVMRAMAAIAGSRPGLPLTAAFYGRGDTLPELEALAGELGIADRVSFPGRIPIEEVPRAVAEADIGVAPTRLDAFTGMSLSTKLLEYAAMEKPVVASRLPTVERYFAADTLSIYEPGDPASLAATILGLVDDAPGRQARIDRTRERVDELSWTRQAEVYRSVVDRLTRRPRDARPKEAAEP
jgi:glycosyltransferase involved in cell wall biosynthesis